MAGSWIRNNRRDLRQHGPCLKRDHPIIAPGSGKWIFPVALRHASAIALTLVLLLAWTLTHQLGFDGDAKLYAFQALARLQPSLTQDIFLQNASQDHYTIFPALYAHIIAFFGLRNAEAGLTILFKLGGLVGVGVLAHSFSVFRYQFLIIAAFIILPAGYGAQHAFRYSEDWLTARTLAETLIIVAIAVHFSGRVWLGLLLAIAAALVHPIMALPGVLMLLLSRAPLKIGAIAAASVMVLSLVCALLSSTFSLREHFLALMDADWLEIVAARSPFLFPQRWSYEDWTLNARPIMSLVLTIASSSDPSNGDPRLRKFAAAALLVGVTGLALASIAGGIGPVALFVQGQAWRWIWVTCFCAVIALVPTVFHMGKDSRNGSLCAMLLVAGWLIPSEIGVLFFGACALLWLARRQLGEVTRRHASWIVGLATAIVIIWLGSRYWTRKEVLLPGAGRYSALIALLCHSMKIILLPAALSALLIHIITRMKSRLALLTLCLFIGLASALMLPSAVRDVVRLSAMVETKEFTDWQRIIPRDATVVMVPSPVSAAVTWFMLDRPSYLSVDQSSGVVFSSATAREIRRRSTVMMPLWDRNWGPEATNDSRPLTSSSLLHVCADARLNFVVAREDVGYGAVRHRSAGIWDGWNLYDCHRVNALAPTS